MFAFFNKFFSPVLWLAFAFCTQGAVAATTAGGARHGMVVTEQKLATQIGVDILQAGGNAIDAAVAVGYALAVVNPCCGNIGGGGFMTLHLAHGKNTFLNFRERAPLAATPDMFLDQHGHAIPQRSTRGYAAVAVPGTVLGMEQALRTYGTMTRQQVMAPAIKLARDGFILGPGDVKLLRQYDHEFQQHPTVAAIFLHNGKSYAVGERLRQPDLAAVLESIAAQGSDVFYQGKIAQALVQASASQGGILTLKDFAQYRVEESAPVTCQYRGHEVIAAPPPSSGGVTLCETLNILEGYPLAALGNHSAQSIHYITEAMRFAFYDRNYRLGDPDFVTNPVRQLTAKSYAATLRRHIKAKQASVSVLDVPRLREGMHTTHYSLIDQAGNAVAVTYTLNSFFGAQEIAPHTGFFLNNEMDDFTASTLSPNQFGLMQGANNKIEPGKRPLSAMSPTIILNQRDGKPLLIVGCPGGPRIITATLLTILNVLDFGMTMQQAVDARRFHHQWLPDVIQMESGAFSQAIMRQLSGMGYQFTTVDNYGAVEAIYIDPRTHLLYGGSDNRRAAGAALGY